MTKYTTIFCCRYGKCYISYRSKQCLEIHEVLLAQIVFALWHSKRMLASHSLNQLLHKIQALC